jgi:hypothetical protein
MGGPFQKSVRHTDASFLISARQLNVVFLVKDIDPTGQYMITATGNRGWAGDATKVVLIHERKKV